MKTQFIRGVFVAVLSLGALAACGSEGSSNGTPTSPSTASPSGDTTTPAPSGDLMSKSETIKAFDHARGEAAENVVVLRDGTACVALLMTGEVWCSNGAVEKVVPSIADAITGGLAADAGDRLYAVVRSAAADVAGVWRREAPGDWKRYAAAPPEMGLNGITFDVDGTLFGADSLNGEVVYLPPGKDALETWLADERLRPTSPDDPISATGANGVKFWDGDLYVTNSARGAVLRIEVDDHQPGAITEVVTGIVADDLAFDRSGAMYLAAHPDNKVLRVDPDGTRTVLATDADGLDGPTAIAVVAGGLIVTNLGLLGTRQMPSVMWLPTEVGEAALPIPDIER